MSVRPLLVIAAVAFLLFAGIILNAAIERDALSCDPQRCVAQRERGFAFGAPSGPREFNPRDVKKVELVAAQMRYGSIWLFEIAGQDDMILRLEMSDAHAYDLRRWFEAPPPNGHVDFAGPRAARNYPFVALLTGIGIAAIFAAVKQGAAKEGEQDEDEKERDDT